MSVESLVDRMEDTCRGLFVGRTWAGGWRRCNGCHGQRLCMVCSESCCGSGLMRRNHVLIPLCRAKRKKSKEQEESRNDGRCLLSTYYGSSVLEPLSPYKKVLFSVAINFFHYHG